MITLIIVFILFGPCAYDHAVVNSKNRSAKRTWGLMLSLTPFGPYSIWYRSITFILCV